MKNILVIAFIMFQSVVLWAQGNPVGLNVKDVAPVFKGVDQNGKIFSLKDELKKGAVVLIFYRGQWCPYCNRELKALEDSLSLIRNKAATLVAVSPEMPVNIGKTIEKSKASFPILFDDSLKIMKQYDVAFSVDKTTIEKYKGYGIDFTQANGSNGANLPVPAVYVINKKGIIVYKYFDKDYRNRASVAQILSYL
jgi:peroxiredoxin